MRWSTLFGLIGKFVYGKNVIAEQRQGSEAKNKYKERTGLQSSQLGTGVEKLTTWVKLLNMIRLIRTISSARIGYAFPMMDLKSQKTNTFKEGWPRNHDLYLIKQLQNLNTKRMASRKKGKSCT